MRALLQQFFQHHILLLRRWTTDCHTATLRAWLCRIFRGFLSDFWDRRKMFPGLVTNYMLSVNFLQARIMDFFCLDTAVHSVHQRWDNILKNIEKPIYWLYRY